MNSGSKGRLEDSDSENNSRVRSQLRKTNLVKSGEGLLASAASHTRKTSLNPQGLPTGSSPSRKDKLNILQNTPQQMQQQRNNFLHASSSIANAMMHTH